MDVLSTESLEKLRRESQSDPELIKTDFETLQDKFNLVMVPFNADIGSLVTLELPEGQTQEKNKDLENCKLLGESFSDLSAAEATDERLWTTLCFRDYSKYAKRRWPLEKAKTPPKHVQNHWFAETNRNRMRDNAISRLWWMAHIAKRADKTNIDKVLETLFFNSDYRSNLLERNSSANSINVVVSILSISQKAFDEGIIFDRDKFRTFMKKVDLIGKRTSLPSLSPLDLEELLLPVYDEAYHPEKYL